MKLQFLLIFLALFILESCTSCSSDADSNKIAEDLADRMTDALDFEGGEMVDSTPPEGNESAEYPQIDSIEEVEELQMGADFIFELNSTYAEPEKVAYIIVYVNDSSKYISIPGHLLNDFITLAGSLNIDDELKGQDFNISFALQTDDKKTGAYKPLKVKIAEQILTEKADIEALAGNFKTQNGDDIQVENSAPPEGNPESNSPQIIGITIPNEISVNEPVEIMIESDFTGEITDAVLTLPNAGSYFILQNENSNNEPVFKSTVYFTAEILDSFANSKLKSGFKASNKSTDLTLLWALQSEENTGLYRATEVTLFDSDLPDPADGDQDIEEDLEKEPDGDLDQELDTMENDLVEDMEEEIVAACECLCDWPGDNFDYDSVDVMYSTSAWKNESSGNYEVTLVRDRIEAAPALNLKKWVTSTESPMIAEFPKCQSCEISFWVETVECPNQSGIIQNNVDVYGTDDNGDTDKLFRFAIADISTNPDLPADPYLVMYTANEPIKLVQCLPSTTFKIHVIPDWQDETLTVFVDDSEPFEQIPFYTKNIRNVSRMELYHETMDREGIFDEIELRSDCEVDGDADQEDEVPPLSKQCEPCSDEQPCEQGLLCLTDDFFCVKQCPDYNQSLCDNDFLCGTYDTIESLSSDICYPNSQASFYCDDTVLNTVDACGRITNTYDCVNSPGTRCNADMGSCMDYP